MASNRIRPFIPSLTILLIFNCLPQIVLCQSHVYNDTSSICSNSSNRSIEYDQCLNYTPEWESCPDPSLCEAAEGNNVGLAFGLTIGAGLATTLGALLPFIPFIKRSNTTFLAIGLALAAGVMLYVSFTEILKKSKDNFCCTTPTHYELAATGCFFGGIVLTILLDLLVGLLQRLDCGCTSKCSRKKNREHEGEEESKSSKFRSSSKDGTTKSGKNRICATNGIHVRKEFDFRMEEGHTPMVSSSEVSTISTPTADSLEEGEEPGIVVSVETHNSETESALDPGMPSCSSQRALLSNEVVSNGGEVDVISMARQNSVSDTESRRHAAITPDVASMTLSENTNNYANASVNELFSNSSLLRMNAAILPETVDRAVVGREVGVVSPDAKSHVSVVVEESGDGVDREGVKAVTPRKLLRRHSYSEMVEQKHDDITEPLGPPEFKQVAMVMGKDARRLHRMGILTGLAVGIHNFPEGLATFVAALSSPSLGIALAIAIALHNIPEGVCVAMPVYYATGKKWKGFLWAFLSGISEPFGALLGWLVFKDLFGPLVYGCLFGVIAGMMVFISLKELLPTAHKFDKRGILVAVFIVVGMVVMAASLLLFLY